MIPIIVCTHGGLARELVNTAEQMLGSQSALTAVCLEMHEGIEDLIRKLEPLLPSARVEDPTAATEKTGCLVMVDMFGGTPSNVALALSRQHPLKVITGVNLPMMIEALTHREGITLEALSELIREKGRDSIILACALLTRTTPPTGG